MSMVAVPEASHLLVNKAYSRADTVLPTLCGWSGHIHRGGRRLGHPSARTTGCNSSSNGTSAAATDLTMTVQRTIAGLRGSVVMVDEILNQTSPLQGNVERSALPHRGKGIRRRELAALCRAFPGLIGAGACYNVIVWRCVIESRMKSSKSGVNEADVLAHVTGVMPICGLGTAARRCHLGGFSLYLAAPRQVPRTVFGSDRHRGADICALADRHHRLQQAPGT